MASVNMAVCPTCKARVPAEHVIRDNRVYLSRTCPDCGVSEGLVSSDAEQWQWKRELCHFDPESAATCNLSCQVCGAHGTPRMVFLDVTNRCNMNCPICVANVQSMKFEFYPPMEYFERVFGGLASWEPKPVVHLFGGEPTCRDDLFEIIDLARSHDLLVSVVTNGLKLADEDYCRRLCEKDMRILLGFDGRHPDIYKGMRRHPSACEKKMQALENMRRFSQGRKNIIMCCVARGINDRYMADTLDLCHEHRDHLKGLYLLPLTENWDNDRFTPEQTTNIEDVEAILDDALEDRLEFLPLGLQATFGKLLSRFGAGDRETFSSVHPNCESATVLVSDGEKYHSISRFLKRPMAEVAEDAVQTAASLEADLDDGDGSPGMGDRVKAVNALRKWWGRNIDSGKMMRGNAKLTTMRFFSGLATGKSLGEQLSKHTRLQDPLKILVLPFEETHSLEAQRLVRCASGFAYEDVETGEIRSIPACAWWLYNRPILQAIQAKYDAAS